MEAGEGGEPFIEGGFSGRTRTHGQSEKQGALRMI
jgi:hypothetical protein